MYASSIPSNFSCLISSSEVDATDVYDNKSSKQITWIIPRRINTEILQDRLAIKLIIIRISITADGCI